jgi:hypothetical protein
VLLVLASAGRVAWLAGAYAAAIAATVALRAWPSPGCGRRAWTASRAGPAGADVRDAAARSARRSSPAMAWP